MLRKVLFGLVALLFGAVGFLMVAGFFGYFLLFPPVPPPPEIGRGLPGNFVEADAEFKRRVAEQFPVPFNEAELISRLEKQGFHIVEANEIEVYRNAKERSLATDIPDKVASFEQNRLVCKFSWSIRWRTEEGFAVEIRALFASICL